MGAFAYDQILYETSPFPESHPDRLATAAILAGMKPARVERCRVLEIGCGGGGNLIPMAFSLPGSQFTGIDLAKAPVENAQQLGEALGLRNVTFYRIDVMDFPPAVGQFDYIIAHGFYSWVPPAVRDKLLDICRSHLAPQGVAYISYNCFPGFHLRNMMRGMLLYQTRNVTDPQQKIRHSFALTNFLSSANPVSQALREELEHQQSRTSSGLFHDDIAEVNHAVYFHEFVEHASRFDLQHLGDADPHDQAAPSELLESIRARANGDVIRSEQYLDFVKLRRFRQSLVCHHEIPLNREPGLEQLTSLYAACPPQMEDPRAARLREVWPMHIPFSEAELPAQFTLDAYYEGILELHAHPPGFTVHLSDRPMAYALARLQLQRGSVLTTLRHINLEVDDPLWGYLLRLLDGTRDLGALRAELEAFAASQGSGMKITPEQLSAILNDLARLALLVS